MARRREVERPSSSDDVPEYARRIVPDRYRGLAEEALFERPQDTFGAALAVWMAWCRERSAWCRENGVTWHERRDLLGSTPAAPFEWVAVQFGTPPVKHY